MRETPDPGELEAVALAVRRNIVRMIHRADGGHIGGSLSSVEILVCLYFAAMRVDPECPEWEDRDRFILSKGHCAAALYAVLAARGYFPESVLSAEFACLRGRLQEHPDRLKVPGVDMSSGSLGQGLSVAAGLALGARLLGKRYRVFVLLGDGECQEGQVWEAAMAGSHYRLDRLLAVVDYNKVQVNDTVERSMALEPLVDKWRSFGWRVYEAPGHDVAELSATLQAAMREQRGPAAVIAHTVKGKGISFMEGQAQWHSNRLSEEQYAQAMAELSGPGAMRGAP